MNHLEVHTKKNIITLRLFSSVWMIVFALLSTTGNATTILHDTPENDTIANHGPQVLINVTSKFINVFHWSSDSTRSAQSPVFPKGSSLTIQGKDDGAVKKIYYVLDDAAEREYNEAIKLVARGRHTLKLRATDRLGNETQMELTFLVVE